MNGVFGIEHRGLHTTGTKRAALDIVCMSVTSIPLSPTSLDCSFSPEFPRMPISPQLSAQQSRRSSSSMSSGARSPKSNRSLSQNQGMVHLSLDLSMHPNMGTSGITRDNIPIPARATVSLTTANVEDSPQLLASSVGEQIGSQLVPSISNISLLSLNQHQQQQLQQHILAVDNNSGSVTNNTNNNNTNSSMAASLNAQELTLRLNTSAQRHFQMQRGPNNSIQHPPSTIGSSRKSSFNSPTTQSVQFFNTSQVRNGKGRRSSSNANPLQQQKAQTIFACRSKRGSMDVPQTPDSPTLAPISLAGSPSNFQLSHSSPPNSLKASSVLSNIQFPLSRYNNLNTPPRSHPGRQSMQMKGPNNNRYTEDIQNVSIPITRGNSLSESIGGRSPQLSPVSTMLPPMTPLILTETAELASRSNSTVMLDDDDDDDDNDHATENETTSSLIQHGSTSNDADVNDAPHINHLLGKDRRMISRQLVSNDTLLTADANASNSVTIEGSYNTIINSSKDDLTDNDYIFGEPTDD